MKTTIKILSIILITGLLTGAITSCNNKEKTTEKPVAEQAEEEHNDALALTDAQIKALGIEFGAVAQKNLSAVIKANGTLEVPPQNQAQVNVLSGGIIRKINVMEGSKVNKGDVIALIENQELLKLQQDYLSVKSGFSFIEAEYSRQTQLKEAGAGTGKFFQQAEANFYAERSRIKALEKQLQQLGISPARVTNGNLSSQYPVLSPISGTIGNINTQTGAYAQPGTSLMDIVDNTKIHADLVVYEKDLRKVQVGQTVSFQLTNQNNQQIQGKIYGINKSFENDSKGVIVHAIINQPGKDLIPGMYVTGLISVGKTLTPAVPIDAVIHAEGKDYIFIVTENVEKSTDNAKEAHNEIHFEKIEVTTGIAELGYIQITPLVKLPANAKVIVKGAFYLQSKSAGAADHD